MDAVARNATRAIFKIHSKEATEEILFGDVGMLSLSFSMLLYGPYGFQNWRSRKKSTNFRRNVGFQVRAAFG
jgi:hypothetical protein